MGSKASPNVRYASDSDRICAPQPPDAMGQIRTHAPQQTVRVGSSARRGSCLHSGVAPALMTDHSPHLDQPPDRLLPCQTNWLCSAPGIEPRQESRFTKYPDGDRPCSSSCRSFFGHHTSTKDNPPYIRRCLAFQTSHNLACLVAPRVIQSNDLCEHLHTRGD